MQTRLWIVPVLALCGCTPEDARPAADGRAPNDVPAAPPIIQNGEGMLFCTISAKENGRQTLNLQKGVGLEFDATVSPIVDGTVDARGPEKGGAYRFTSHLAGAAKGKLAGVGDVAIDDLETRVNVEMNRYQQPGGPGTRLEFTSGDMASRGIYVEFTGHAHAENGDRYAFRVTLGQPGEGSKGAVEPGGPGPQAPIYSKMVTIQAPVTTVVTTTATKLR